MNKALLTYKKLEKHYGYKNWWPVTEQGSIIPTPPTKKLTEAQRFEIILGAILTQNTSWNNVLKALIELNKKGLLSLEKINRLDEKKLAQIIRSSGYYNKKAIKVKAFCAHVMNKHNGSITKMLSANENLLREELLTIHGIGKETADAIILFAAEKQAFVIDSYAKRIFHRIGICRENPEYDELAQILTSQLKKDAYIYNQYHAHLVSLGQDFCKKGNPTCTGCPLKKICTYGKNNNQ